jgi:hypothetical protein
MSQVKEKVAAALAHLCGTNEEPTVAKVCRLAEVSRANLYSTYPELIDAIRKKRKKNSQETITKPVGAKDRSRTAEIMRLRQENKVLAYACVELRSALDREREKAVFLKTQLDRVNVRKR